MLINTFHFQPVAVAVANQFGQWARIDNYDDFAHIITFGMAGDGKNVAEVHCFITEKSTISSHQGDCPVLARVGPSRRPPRPTPPDTTGESTSVQPRR